MVITECYEGRLADRRNVLTGGEFFGLEREQMVSLLRDFYEFVIKLYGERFILDWFAMGHGDLKDSKIPRWIAEAEETDSLGFGGILRSEKIKNKTDYRRHEKKLAYTLGPDKEYPFFSEGYGEYYERYILDSWPDIEKIMQGIETICNLEGKTPLDNWGCGTLTGNKIHNLLAAGRCISPGIGRMAFITEPSIWTTGSFRWVRSCMTMLRGAKLFCLFLPGAMSTLICIWA